MRKAGVCRLHLISLNTALIYPGSMPLNTVDSLVLNINMVVVNDDMVQGIVILSEVAFGLKRVNVLSDVMLNVPSDESWKGPCSEEEKD